MPKGIYEIKNFAGGLNAYADPRDIEDNHFSQNWNIVVDKDGILRIVGSAVESINASLISNTNFQKGYGLFQFSTDYSLGSPNFDGSFESGYETGKVDSIPVNDPVTNTTIFVLEDTSAVSSSNDYYNGMFIYFYAASNNAGETRVISDYVGSSRTVTLESATSGIITTNDKYMIFRWESDNWEITDSKKDFVVTERTTGAIALQGINGGNFIATKGTATDEKSVNLGNVTFTPNGKDSSTYLTLTPGIEYTLSFDCAALDRWYNLVANGYTTGITDTTINVAETESISTSSVTLTVSGSATATNILNRDVYKSDGTFIGRCTAVNSTTEIVFANGIQTALASPNDLYVSGFGDKPPWVELYSTTVEHENGTIKSLSDDTPAVSGGGFTTWTASKNSDGTDDDYTNLIQNNDAATTSTSGTGASFNVVTDGSGNPTFYIAGGGSGYSINDTIRIDDPTDPSNKYSTLTIASINTKGLTLLDGGWVSQNDNETALAATPKYLVNKDVNYVVNGDFALTDIDYGWTTVGSNLSLAQTSYSDSSSSGSAYGNIAYGGHDGSLRIMTSEGFSNWDTEPDEYIHQTLTLDGGTWYHLNFLYTIHGNGNTTPLNKPAFALYDDTLNQYITNWTICNDISSFWDLHESLGEFSQNIYWASTLHTEYYNHTNVNSVFNGDTSYKNYKDIPSGPFHRLNYSDDEGQVGKQTYHKFFVPKSHISQTSNISLRFTLNGHSAGSRTWLAGVTVHKAYNDLTTMSYTDSDAANPFTENVKNWSNYKLQFKVPENFSEVSDWKLKIHGGKYGFRESNEFNVNPTEHTEIDSSVGVLTISTFTNYSGYVNGTTKATTSANHGLSTGDVVAITSSPNAYFDGKYSVTVIDGDDFYFEKAYSPVKIEDNGTAVELVSYNAKSNQEVYLDNISLRSPSSSLNAFDTSGITTLLTSNRGSDSVIKMWNGTVWKTLATWDDKNAMPVYDYVNGILKISDANFDNNNENKFIYFDDENTSNMNSIGTWKQQTSPIISPPSPHIEYKDASALGGGFTYNACHYLNLLYSGYKWCTYPSTTMGTSDFQWTNWSLDEFADAGYDSHGMGHIIRYTPDERHSHGNAYDPTSASWSVDHNNKFIADPDDEHKQATTMGLNLLYSNGDNYGGVCSLNYLNSPSNVGTEHWEGKSVYSSMQTLNCLIHASGISSYGRDTVGKGIVEFIDNQDAELATNSSVARINYKIRWEAALSSREHNNITYNLHCDGSTETNQADCEANDGTWVNEIVTKNIHQVRPPWFKIEAAVILDAGNPLDIIQNVECTGVNLSNVKRIYHGKVNGNPPSIGINQGRVYGDNPCTITKYQHMEADDGNSPNQVIVEVLMEGSFTWNPGELPMNTFTAEDILFRISEEDFVHNQVHGNDVEDTYIGDTWQSCYTGGTQDTLGGEFDTTRNLSLNPGTHPTSSQMTPGEGNTSWNSGSTTRGFRIFRKFPGSRYPTWTRFFVDKIDIEFFDQDAEMPGLSEGEAIANFMWETPEEYLENNTQSTTGEGFIVSGWGGRIFQMATTTVNKFNEESALSTPTDINTTFNLPSEDQAPSIEVFLSKSYYHNDFIKKTKFYLRDGESDIWYLQFWVDHKENKMYSSTSVIPSEYKFNATPDMWGWNLSSINFKSFNEVNSYESETLVKQEDASSNTKLTCRYKTSVVCNNRMYVGNVLQGGKRYGDRMLKSPIGKYNIFPESSFVDVAINDGDEITALAYYKDKLLQFKKRKVFVINVSGDYEYLDDTFNDIGVHGQFSVVRTKSGIVWANATGCYLYDGEKVENLIDKKIPINYSYSNRASDISSRNRWCATSETGDCVVGYLRQKDTILVNFTREATATGQTPSGAVYHFPTKSWSLIYAIWNSLASAAAVETGNISNMITDNNGDILFYHIDNTLSTSAMATHKINTIRKWVHEPDSTLTTKPAYFATKDISFGNINVKKKLYKVYITYRVLTGTGTPDSGVQVTGSVNGTGDFDVAFSQTSKFINTQDLCYEDATLNFTSGTAWKTAQLEFNAPSDVKNITSFQLLLSGASVRHDFEVNDISISFKVKNVK